MNIDENNEIRRETDQKSCRETHDVGRPGLCKDNDGILVSSEKGNTTVAAKAPSRDAEGWLLPPSDGRRRSKRLQAKHKAQIKAAIARDIRSWEWFGEQQRAAAAAPLLEAGVHPSNITYVYGDDARDAVRRHSMNAYRRGPCGPEGLSAPPEPLKWSRATWGRLPRTEHKDPLAGIDGHLMPEN